jgi:hypothetical protein
MHLALVAAEAASEDSDAIVLHASLPAAEPALTGACPCPWDSTAGVLGSGKPSPSVVVEPSPVNPVDYTIDLSAMDFSLESFMAGFCSLAATSHAALEPALAPDVRPGCSISAAAPAPPPGIVRTYIRQHYRYVHFTVSGFMCCDYLVIHAPEVLGGPRGFGARRSDTLNKTFVFYGLRVIRIPKNRTP